MSSRVDGCSGVTTADPGQAQRPTFSNASSSPVRAVTSHSTRSSRLRAAVLRDSRCVRAPDGRVDGTEMEGRERAIGGTQTTRREGSDSHCHQSAARFGKRSAIGYGCLRLRRFCRLY